MRSIKARYIGPDKELWMKTLERGSVHRIYLTSFDRRDQEGYISIDEESYPITLEELINDWELS